MEDFREKIFKLKSVESVRGKKYEIVDVNDKYIVFKRSHKNTNEKILISELYNFYKEEDDYKTTTAKSYISGIVQSPSVAILKELTKKPTDMDEKGGGKRFRRRD